MLLRVIVGAAFLGVAAVPAYAQVELYGGELELGRRAREGMVRYLDYDAYARAVPEFVRTIPQSVVDGALRTPEQFMALPEGLRLRLLGRLNWNEDPAWPERVRREWSRVREAWVHFPSADRRSALRFNELSVSALAEITAEEFIRHPELLRPRADSPVEVQDVLSRFHWSFDGTALEFRHAQPQVFAEDYLRDIELLARWAGMERRLRAGSSRILRPGSPHGRGAHFSYHLHYSRSGADLTPVASLLNLYLAQHIAAAGGTPFDFASSRVSFSSATNRGLVRLLADDHLELRRHFTDPRTEARLLREWVEHPERLVDLILARLTPEFMATGVSAAGHLTRGAGVATGLMEALRVIERYRPGSVTTYIEQVRPLAREPIDVSDWIRRWRADENLVRSQMAHSVEVPILRLCEAAGRLPDAMLEALVERILSNPHDLSFAVYTGSPRFVNLLTRRWLERTVPPMPGEAMHLAHLKGLVDRWVVAGLRSARAQVRERALELAFLRLRHSAAVRRATVRGVLEGRFANPGSVLSNLAGVAPLIPEGERTALRRWADGTLPEGSAAVLRSRVSQIQNAPIVGTGEGGGCPTLRDAVVHLDVSL